LQLFLNGPVPKPATPETGHASAKVPALNQHVAHTPSDARHPNHALLLGSALIIVLGGFFNAWCEKQSHEELAHQYNRMNSVFSLGSQELETALAELDGLTNQTPRDQKAEEAIHARIRSFFEILGQEAMTEHASWLMLRRARPFELHLG